MTRQQTENPGIAHTTSFRPASVAATLICAASMMVLPTYAAAEALVSVAVFDFELEDGSAAAFATEAADAARVAEVSQAARL
jgi:hypothetical protein